MQKLVAASNSLTRKRLVLNDSIVMTLFFLVNLISMPTVPVAMALLFWGKWTPIISVIESLFSSYILRKSEMYVFWVRGNLA